MGGYVIHLLLLFSTLEESEYGTVGCIVVDKDGHTASATSTGGLNGQMKGRVGDTPIIGAGGYADDQVCFSLHIGK